MNFIILFIPIIYYIFALKIGFQNPIRLTWNSIRSTPSFVIDHIRIVKTQIWKCIHFMNILIKVLWTVIIQKIIPKKQYTQISISNKKYIKIPYVYNDQKYFYLIKVPKGKEPIRSIEDENNIDILDSILPYLGPNMDCHNLNLTPEDFGYQEVKITTVFDKVVVFKKNEKISF